MYPEKNKGKPDWELVKNHLFKEGRVDKSLLVHLIKETIDILNSEPNLLQ
jgi:serine/threonine-protein phosphatase 2B catalytic subunit